MKFPRLPTLVLTLLFSFPAAQAQVVVLSNFGGSATKDGSWLYSPSTNTISGTEGFGDFLFGTPLTVNIGHCDTIQLAGNATTAPTGTFVITLEDANTRLAIATFDWADFTGGATVTESLTFDTMFDSSNVVRWKLISGGSLQSLNVSLSQLSAVPEPSTMLLMLFGVCTLWSVRNRLKERVR